jgi:hypothetical protein
MTSATAVQQSETSKLDAALATMHSDIPGMPVDQMLSAMKILVSDATGIDNTALFLKFLAAYSKNTLILIDRLYNYIEDNFSEIKAEHNKTRNMLSESYDMLSKLVEARTQELPNISAQIAAQSAQYAAQKEDLKQLRETTNKIYQLLLKAPASAA